MHLIVYMEAVIQLFPSLVRDRVMRKIKAGKFGKVKHVDLNNMKDSSWPKDLWACLTRLPTKCAKKKRRVKKPISWPKELRSTLEKRSKQ